MALEAYKGNLIMGGIVKGNVHFYHNDEWSIMRKLEDMAVYHDGITWRGTRREIEEKFGTDMMVRFLKWLHPDLINRYARCPICGCLIYDGSAAFCVKCKDEGNRRMQQALEETPPQEFANIGFEVIKSIVFEYRQALKQLKKNPNNGTALAKVQQDKEWFKSPHFELLSLGLIHGERIIQEVRNEVESDTKRRKR